MIICNRCGTENGDAEHLCVKCGHKLQSLRREEPASEGSPFLKERIEYGFWSRSKRVSRGYLEAWIYALVLLATAWACQYQRVWWPLYAMGALVLVLVIVRKIRPE